MLVRELKEGSNYRRRIAGQYIEEIRVNKIDPYRDFISFTPNTGANRGRKETELNLAYVAHTIEEEVVK